MFAIASIVVRSSESYSFYNGSLFPLPPDLRGKPQLDAYGRIKQLGWGTSDFGYHYFSFRLGSGDRIIFPGLLIQGEKPPKRKFPSYNHAFTKPQVESFAESIKSYSEEVASLAQADLNMLVHDLRGISNTIYNSALEAKLFLSRGNITETETRIENVIASQGLLKIRTDALDFVGNTASIITVEDISVFRKVDKVVRTFKAKAFSQRKTLHLNGGSFKHVRGPSIVELIPYTLLDNALKYSPDNSTIEVEIVDDSPMGIGVTSYGPQIRQDEREEIFAKGFRGIAASSSGVPGSGVGLYIVKKLVTENFGGSIEVDQDIGYLEVDGTRYYRTTFTVRLPTIE